MESTREVKEKNVYFKKVYECIISWLNKNELIFKYFIVEKYNLKYKVFLIAKKFFKIKYIWSHFNFVIFCEKELLINLKAIKNTIEQVKRNE